MFLTDIILKPPENAVPNPFGLWLNESWIKLTGLEM